MTNRFKGIGFIDGMLEEVWTEVQEEETETISKKKKCKMIVYGGFTTSKGKKRSERKGSKGTIYPNECSVSENSKER